MLPAVYSCTHQQIFGIKRLHSYVIKVASHVVGLVIVIEGGCRSGARDTFHWVCYNNCYNLYMQAAADALENNFALVH